MHAADSLALPPAVIAMPVRFLVLRPHFCKSFLKAQEFTFEQNLFFLTIR